MNGRGVVFFPMALWWPKDAKASIVAANGPAAVLRFRWWRVWSSVDVFWMGACWGSSFLFLEERRGGSS